MKKWIAVLMSVLLAMSCCSVGVLAAEQSVVMEAKVDGVGVASAQMTISAKDRALLLEKNTDQLSAKLTVPENEVTDGNVRVAVVNGRRDVFAKYTKEENRPYAAFTVSLVRTPKTGQAETVETLPEGVSYDLSVALPQTDHACNAWAVARQVATEDGVSYTLTDLRLVTVADGRATFTADTLGTYVLIGLTEETTETVEAGFSWWLFLFLAAGVVLLVASILSLCLVWRRKKVTADETVETTEQE